MVYLFLADGFEECEALAPLDILRRAGIEVKTVGVTGEYVTGSHSICLKADIGCENIVLDDNLTAIILPGGMPGTINLEKSDTVQKAIDYANEKNKLICAICAAPQILGHKNLLKGKKATCFKYYFFNLIDFAVKAWVVFLSRFYNKWKRIRHSKFALAL